MGQVKAVLPLLRVPFSFFLLPVFLFALLPFDGPPLGRTLMVFFVLHLLLYPAANSFNSVFDRDREGIGGLKNPPSVPPALLLVSLLLDAAALVLALRVSFFFAAGCLIYGLAAKAYSLRAVRIKRFPVAGWLYTSIGQGFLTALLVAGTLGPDDASSNLKAALVPAGLATLLLMGFYPLSQVYQHREDGERGDCTLSRMLGIRGTFFFAAPFLFLSLFGFFWYILFRSGITAALIFCGLMLPGLLVFARWFYRVRRDPSAADWYNTFRLSVAASAGLNAAGLFALTLN